MAYKFTSNVIGIFLFVVSFNVNAALLTRLDGHAVYDTDRDITWLTDANLASTMGYDFNGLMDYQQTQAFIDSLNASSLYGYTGWRMPTTLIPDSTCQSPSTSYGHSCSGSEMGHLFYTELTATYTGGFGFIASLNDNQPNPFDNLRSSLYWSSTERSALGQYYTFATGMGTQDWTTQTQEAHVLILRDGDVAMSVVPVPAALWLFCSGLIGLVGFARGKKV
jgi:hypothetical protein